MTHARSLHPSAPLTVGGVGGWCVVSSIGVGRLLQRRSVSRLMPRPVQKGPNRRLVEGDDGLQDRSRRPRRPPNRAPCLLQRQVLHLRRRRQ